MKCVKKNGDPHRERNENANEKEPFIFSVFL